MGDSNGVLGSCLHCSLDLAVATIWRVNQHIKDHLFIFLPSLSLFPSLSKIIFILNCKNKIIPPILKARGGKQTMTVLISSYTESKFRVYKWKRSERKISLRETRGYFSQLFLGFYFLFLWKIRKLSDSSDSLQILIFYNVVIKTFNLLFSSRELEDFLSLIS